MSAADDAALAAAVFGVDPVGLGGVCLRSLAQPARDQWLSILRDSLPAAVAMRRIPFNIPDGRLLGGLDLTATLRANRPVAERGVLALSDGGVVVLAMAERVSPHTAACLNAVLDAGEIDLGREGVAIRDPARVGIVALDESMADNEQVPQALLDRFAFLIDLRAFDLRTPLLRLYDADEIVAARALLPRVTMPSHLLSALCATAMALGAGSLRVSLLAVRATRALAALAGRVAATTEDAVIAGRLVFAPRATTLPSAQAPEEEAPVSAETPSQPREPTEPPSPTDTAADDEPAAAEPRAAHPQDLEDVVLQAALTAIPHGLLERLQVVAATASPAVAAGRAGALRRGGARGRPSGVRSGAPRGHARLNVMETLRAAAPWQRLRGRVTSGDGRIRIDPGDFRVTQYQQRAQTLTIFAVDASGSSALNRLAEAKGAVELLLADCYVRRDQVAVVTFRGRGAELLLPPTRSLVRAKRSLAGLPGGGGTPLAAALDRSLALACQAQRRGDTPLVVLLTDGRANVSRDGAGGRDAAHAEALKAARQMGQARIAVLFVDTSPRPNPLAQVLAAAMRAQYVPLPYANASSLSRAVTAGAARAGL